MKIAIIEHGCREYILDTFQKHPEFDGGICCFAEHRPKKKEDRGIPVVSLSNLKEQRLDAVLIAVKENRYLSRLLTFLHCEGIGHVYVIRLFALDTKADFLAGNSFSVSAVDRISSKKPYLVHLESHVCDHCNLNCKACNNFSPFATEPSFADPTQFETDMRHVSRLFSGIGRLFLLGGEPLLAPELSCELIRLSRRYFPNTELRLLTNALLLTTMPDGFWNCLRENNVIIHISLYPPVKPKFSEIETVLKQQKVTYLIFKEVTTFCKHWTEYPFEDEQFNNNCCGSAGCHYLRDGVLAKCPDAVLIGKMAGAMDCAQEELQSKEKILLADCTDGWEVLRALDAPIDLCRKCSYRRKELVEWGRVDGTPQPSDWLIPHAFEEENQKLKQQIAHLTAELKSAGGRLSKLERQLEDEQKKRKAESERLKESEAKLSLTEDQMSQIRLGAENERRKNRAEIERSKKLETQLKIAGVRLIQAEEERENERRRSRAELDRLKSSELKWRRECEETKKSISFRAGRFVTWFPRRLHVFIGSLRARGIKDTAKSLIRKIGKKILPQSLNKLNNMFFDHVLSGYRIYDKLLREYGEETKFLGCAWHGTGDYYICGLYLDSWLKSNNVGRFVFFNPGGAEAMAAKLFPSLAGGTVCFDGYKFSDLCTLRGFVGVENCNVIYLHHQEPFPCNSSRMLTNSDLMGYKGLNMVDFYLLFGFKMAPDVLKSMPVFKTDEKSLERCFAERELFPGRTVMLSPYSTGLQEHCPAPEFWESLARELKQLGYTVCTNCAGKEPAVKGSVPLLLPYDEIVPFLNMAGNFVGIRSGLCDIISTSACKKVVVHPYFAKYWPNGASINYTGLNQMGLCRNAAELEYRCSKPGDLANLRKEIVNFLA